MDYLVFMLLTMMVLLELGMIILPGNVYTFVEAALILFRLHIEGVGQSGIGMDGQEADEFFYIK